MSAAGTIGDDFATFDETRWFPYYLPHWSTRELSRTRFDIGDGLRLRIDPDQNLWCEGLHEEPLRVSAIQSAAVPGQQPFREGLEVHDDYPPFLGFTPVCGEVAVTMSGDVSPRSMFADWLSGVEETPEQSGEICIAEIFGADVRRDGVEVGIGIKQRGDPALRQDFLKVELDLDVAEQHTYAACWTPEETVFLVDGRQVRHIAQAPKYPMQLMIGVFDFPAQADGDERLPAMRVTRVAGAATKRQDQ
ncbi:MAG: glycoside hydrolase family 16 protein [Microbacterium sp.]